MMNTELEYEYDDLIIMIEKQRHLISKLVYWANLVEINNVPLLSNNSAVLKEIARHLKDSFDLKIFPLSYARRVWLSYIVCKRLRNKSGEELFWQIARDNNLRINLENYCDMMEVKRHEQVI